MNNLKDAKNELIRTLTTNAAINAWAVDELTVIEGQREVENISGTEYPVLIMEIGDAELDAYMIGDTRQDVIGDLFEFSFGWYNNSGENLLDQRLELVQLVKDALSGNKKLNNGTNNTVDNCRLSSYQNDKTVFHPNHFMNFVVHVETSIN